MRNCAVVSPLSSLASLKDLKGYLSAFRYGVGRLAGAFVKAGHTRAGQRHQFEIRTGRVEASQQGGKAVVRDLDPSAKRRVQVYKERPPQLISSPPYPYAHTIMSML